MNNIQKSFKVKSALRKAHGDHDGDEVACMADGGLVQRMQEEQHSGVRRFGDNALGRGLDSSDAAAHAAVSSAKRGLDNADAAAHTAVNSAGSALRKAIGLKDGGPVKGPGGPVDDKVPAMLSHGEYVLPADTVQAIGAHNLDAVKDATHTPAQPQQLGSPLRRPSRMKLANGGLAVSEADPEEFEAARNVQRIRSAMPSAPPSTVVTPNNTGYGQLGAGSQREEMLRSQAAAQRANALHGPGVTEATPADLDAARAVHGPGVADATQADLDAARAQQAAASKPNFTLGEGPTNPGPGPVSAAESAAADSAVAGGSAPGVAADVAKPGFVARAGKFIRSPLSSTVDALTPSAFTVGKVAGTATRFAKAGLVDAAALSALRGFGDYKPAGDIDTSAAGTIGYGLHGQGGRMLDSAGEGAKLALADSLRGVAKTVDDVGGYFGAQPGAVAGVNNLVRNHLSGISLRNPDPVAGAPGAPGAPPKPMFITGDSGQVPDSALALSAAAATKQAADDARMKAVAATGGDPNSTYYDKGANDVVGQFNGKNITRGQSDALAGKIGLAGDPSAANAAAAASALRAPNLDAMGSGFNRINSSAGDINAHFDGLAKQIQQLHGSSAFHANGSLATKLLRLEEARAEALGRDQSNQVSSQGNQVSDLANKRSNASSIYGTDVAEQSALRRDGVTERDSARSAQVALNKQASDDADKNFQNTRQLISDIYPNDKDGNPTNGVAASKVTERLARNPLVVDPATGKQVDFTQASKAQQLQLLPALAAESQMADAANGSALFRHPNANATVIGTADPDLGVGGAINAILHGAGVASTANHIFNPTMTNDKLDTLDDGTVRFEGDLTGEDSTKRSILRARKGGN